MSDLFQEIEEEYRREQVAKIWAKYRIAIIAGVTALVVGVAGFEAWRYWRADQLEKSSRGYEAAVELVTAGDQKKAAEALAKLVQSGAGGYAMVARLQQAALMAEMGDVKGGVAQFDAIAADTRDPLFRDYAHLRAALLLADTAKYEDLSARLGPIAEGGGPWKTMAQELLGYVSWRAGKNDAALKLFEEVQKSPDAESGSKRRALELTALINSGVKPADVKPPTQNSDSLLPPTGGPLLPSLTPSTPTPAQPDSNQPSSLLGSPEQPSTP